MKKRLVTALLSLCLLLSMSGCMGDKPENIIDKFCTAVIAYDEKTASQYIVDGNPEGFVPQLEIDSDADTTSIIEYIKENASNITYEIGEVSIDEDYATVPVHFTFVDASPIMVSTLSDYLSQAFLLAFSGVDDSAIDTLLVTIFNEKVDTVDAADASIDIDFACEKVDGDWKISILSEEIRDDLMAVLTCNITKANETFW